MNDPTLIREPDVRLTPRGEMWEIEFLSPLQDGLEVVELPRQARSTQTGEALAQARALKQALEIRDSALKQVVRRVVDRQAGFFRHGPEALEPMSLSDIAKETGFHLSTVSRILNGLLIEGPNGIVLARALFSNSASTSTALSKAKVQARMRALLAQEDRKQPHSDRALTALLQQEGLQVSRRVVSNYRQEMGFLPASKRRLR